MFPSRYFPDRYFAPRYFPKIGATSVVVTHPVVLSVSRHNTPQAAVANNAAAIGSVTRHATPIAEATHE